MEKSSETVIEYIETRILAGKLRVDDKLPTERDMASLLGVSRTEVRDAIRLLELMGIVERRQGSGNYIAHHSAQNLEQVLTIMYALDDLSYKQIREFRYAVERQALVQAVNSKDEKAKKELLSHLDGVLYGETEEQQTESDRMLHLCLVQMSENRFVIANYMALNRIINRFIPDVRKKIRDQSEEVFHDFQIVHKKLVEAVLDGDLDMAKEAMDQHYFYIAEDFET